MSAPLLVTPNCHGCGGYHGSETVLIRCLERRIARLETEARLLRAFKADLEQFKVDHDAYPMTRGGTAEARRNAGRQGGSR